MEDILEEYRNARLWPWAFAVASALPSGMRKAARASCAEVLKTYPSISSYAENVSWSAMAALAGEGTVFGGSPDLCAATEQRIIGLLRQGLLVAWGRDPTGGILRRIEASDWVGAEVLHERSTSMVGEGWGLRAGDLETILRKETPDYWRSDIHVTSASMRMQFETVPGLSFLLVPAAIQGSTYGIEEARSRAIFGTADTAPLLLIDGEGESTLEVPAVAEGDAETFSASLFEGYSRINSALRTGSIDAVVQSRDTGEYRRVPKDFWFEERFGVEFYDLGVDDAFVGQPILVDDSRLQAWVRAVHGETSQTAKMHLQLDERDIPPRASSFKRGPPPSDDDILKKGDELHKQGMTVQEIAKKMRFEDGFEHVANTHVRELLKGRYRRVGRAGNKGA